MINNLSMKLIISKLKRANLLNEFLELTFNIKIIDNIIFHYKDNAFYFYNYPNIIIYKFLLEEGDFYQNVHHVNNKIIIHEIFINSCKNFDEDENIIYFAKIFISNKKEIKTILDSYLPSKIVKYFI